MLQQGSGAHYITILSGLCQKSRAKIANAGYLFLSEIALDLASAADEPADHIAEAILATEQQVIRGDVCGCGLGPSLVGGDGVKTETFELAAGGVDEQRLV